MRAELVNPFVRGASNVIGMLVSVTPTLGGITALPRGLTTQQVNVVCGVTGHLQGQLILGMSDATSRRIASAMLGGMDADDELLLSSLAELGNMISGNSVTELATGGFECDITPPSMIRGTDVQISTVDIPAVVISLTLAELGTLEVTVSLKDRAAAKAA
jgi:chemotaxis protein CheX